MTALFELILAIVGFAIFMYLTTMAFSLAAEYDEKRKGRK